MNNSVEILPSFMDFVIILPRAVVKGMHIFVLPYFIICPEFLVTLSEQTFL
ncbi:MAG: hypothetical protein QW478_03420 [Candidatus Micrarchaeaceae archaeon]